MQGLLKEEPGPGHVRLAEVPEPHPGPGQVRIAVQAAGICGSDLHILHDDIKLLVRPPVVMGHEFSGYIDELGAGVTDWKMGDRVTAETAVRTCGRCLSCRTGSPNRCSQKEIIGYIHDGAFAPYTVVYAERLHRLPDEVDYVSGAMTEPLACCVRLLCDMTVIRPHDLVVVAGPGAIGLLCAQVAKAAGARVCLVGTSVDADRLHVAAGLGLTWTLRADQDDVAAAIMDASDGEGADVYVEASGAPAAARMGLELTRRNGQYAQIGLAGGAFPLDLSLLAYKELRMVGSLGQTAPGWTRALGMMASGQVQVRPLATHVLPLSRWDEGFRLFESKEGIKVILIPGQ
ncbi:MAG: alcohol dehydrogenase catalytic domain-containing protein [Anaerolineae bacterium]|nr:alcohol dehydrogenase catalytic domain-containing protein [Anaerolineae bacterium]